MLLNIRDKIAADADIIAMVATIIAGFVIVVKMIRFHYNISSDEKGSGFGENVRAWDFLKPLVLLLALNFSPQMARLMNDVVEECMSALEMNAEANHFKAMYIAQLTTQINNIEDTYPQVIANRATYDAAIKENEARAAAAADAAESTGYWITDDYTSYGATKKEGHVSLNPYDPATGSGASAAAEVLKVYDKLQVDLQKSRRAPATEVLEKNKNKGPKTDAASMLERAAKDSVEDVELSLSTLTDALYKWIWDMFIDVLMWLYNMIILIRLFMGTVAMSVILYFFPLIFLAMLFDRYKGAFGSVVVVYVELALWRPIASLLQYVSTAAISDVGTGLAANAFVLMVLIATIFSANEIGMYAKYALTAFNGSGGNASGKSGLGNLKNMIK